ncbi:hypothetical protein K432DRAFT_312957 [Lepidopterella palustris CBS 459.81]|uniref:Helix-turn-helix domain-containing protein n=1 Tax=Lepidopterella palustris CBS 459.81 TaxID=1314670 RepID=A0A8E2J8M4_9PEZI|nr:hypothetical protein K432DRAFT_312957 [Lepidopterella palustris CBS 459.81]
MQRSCGTEISGNRGRIDELTESQRAGILSAVEAGESMGSIASRFGCTRRCIYKTIERWNTHHPIGSLPQSGQPKKLTRRLLLRIARQHPRIEYMHI